MRYAFIINPYAGQGGHDKGIARNIEELINEQIDTDIGVYYTRCPGDATTLSDVLAEEAMKAGDDIVVFGCGGDGTANEIANGIYGYDNAILGLVPVGSGNDLVREIVRGNRYYKDYLNLDLLMKGTPRDIDIMKITWTEDGEEKERISVNSINIGFDGNTAVRAAELKEKPLLSGSGAYIMAVLSTLVQKDGQSLRITADGKPFYEGDLLLATVGNGGYCGGGIRSCPYAILDDGKLELMAIRDMSRISFVSKFPKFRAGRMFDIRGVEEFATYRRVREAFIEPLKSDTMKYVADGEVMNTSAIKVKVEPKALPIWEI